MIMAGMKCLRLRMDLEEGAKGIRSFAIRRGIVMVWIRCLGLLHQGEIEHCFDGIA